MSRKPKFSEALFSEICEHIASGKTLVSICRERDISRRTVLDWVRASEQKSNRFARARADGCDAIACDALDIADNTDEDPQSRRVRVDTRLKLLACWNPKRYGQQKEIEDIGARPVNIVVVIGGDRERAGLDHDPRRASVAVHSLPGA